MAIEKVMFGPWLEGRRVSLVVAAGGMGGEHRQQQLLTSKSVPSSGCQAYHCSTGVKDLQEVANFPLESRKERILISLLGRKALCAQTQWYTP